MRNILFFVCLFISAISVAQPHISCPYCYDSTNPVQGYWTKSGSNIYNNNSGNVGVGNSTPQSIIDVADSGAISILRVGDITNLGLGKHAGFFGVQDFGGAGFVYADNNVNGAPFCEQTWGNSMVRMDTGTVYIAADGIISINAAGSTPGGFLVTPPFQYTGSTPSSNSVLTGDNSGNATWGINYSSAFGTKGTLVALTDSGNAHANNFESRVVLDTTNGGTIHLTSASAQGQLFVNGTGSDTVNLPDATTVFVGHPFTINNNGSGTIYVHYHDGSSLYQVPPNNFANISAQAVTTSNGKWDNHYSLISNGSVGQIVESLGPGLGYSLIYYNVLYGQTYDTVTTLLGTANLTAHYVNYIEASGAITSCTLTLPGSPADGDVLVIAPKQTIGTLAYSGGTVVGGITSSVPATPFKLMFSSARGIWQPVG